MWWALTPQRHSFPRTSRSDPSPGESRLPGGDSEPDAPDLAPIARRPLKNARRTTADNAVWLQQIESESIEALRAMDRDGDGYIEFEDFARAIMSDLDESFMEGVRREFDEMDDDGDGYVDLVEVADMFGRRGTAMTPKQCEDFIAMFDRDGDGRISWDEFMARVVDVPASPSGELMSICRPALLAQEDDSIKVRHLEGPGGVAPALAPPPRSSSRHVPENRPDAVSRRTGRPAASAGGLRGHERCVQLAGRGRGWADPD